MEIKHNKPEKSLMKQSVLIYGAAGVGKTTFCSQIPGVLFLATEKGYRSLDVDVIDVNNWQDLIDSVDYISRGEHQYKTIVIDTVDNLLYLAGEIALKRYNSSKRKMHKYMCEVPFREAHSMAREMIRQQLYVLSKLPYGLYLISHAVPQTDDTGIIKYVPSLDKGIASLISFFVDIILYVKPDKIRKESVAYTKPTMGYDAKDRTGLLSEHFDFRFKIFEDLFHGIRDYKAQFKEIWANDKDGAMEMYQEKLKELGKKSLNQMEYKKLIEIYKERNK